MRSIRYRRGTRRYRHSKRKEKRYVFFTTIMQDFGTLSRNYRIYDIDALEKAYEKAYGNPCCVLNVNDDALEVIKSIKNDKSGPKIVVDSLPALTTDIRDTDGNKINVKLKISKITKHISDFSDMEDIVDEE